MTIKVFTDRTRVIEHQRCHRRRWLGYHQGGAGLQSRKTPLPQGVGAAVHAGLAALLREGHIPTTVIESHGWESIHRLLETEEQAVSAALADFRRYANALELDAGESAAMQPTEEALRQTEAMIRQAAELGMADTAGLGLDREQSRSEFDRYLFAEQSALVEGLVRAYARRRLRPLLEQFEVLEVEREGEWKLSEWRGDECRCGTKHADHWDEAHPYNPDSYDLWFMSRPDALLRERRTNELYLLSYKTAASWDVRKARDIERDMQGLSEGVEVERRLALWYEAIITLNAMGPTQWPGRDTALASGMIKIIMADGCAVDVSTSMFNYLSSLPAPPRIHAIRYEFLLKGERWEDKELSARLGMTVRTQRSHLVRQYVAASVPARGDGGYRVGDVCWSHDFYRPEDDRESKLAWQNWKARAVWSYVGVDRSAETGGGSSSSGTIGVSEWIDALDASELLMSGDDSTIGLPPRALGWKSRAQAMGVTREHPLDTVFPPPVVVYRNDDDLRDWFEQTAEQERRVAEGVAAVAAAGDEGERRHLLNVHFPMFRHSCSYPSECQFVKVCFGVPEAKADPMATGQFVARQLNHPQEAQGIDSGNRK